ncbi:T9SS type A sorting domain-containing protein [Taibaiella lutea]|uniref:T9SS type A sorting domain-containing protein n=1 Tax=Taibaiella lutea TaxID=2608001 RepID=A0A5M6CMY2_9BACT|nr:T9SS type A sorting domain-containing protein [Taibaiella lutea]KAA5536578.1 T9SS type A sorting domain-containing protein [Taibaiella lutea]
MMKKTLLLGGLMLSAWFTQAQQRLALYEEFSGENCAPCAATNPGLWTLISAAGNDTKVLMLKYQTPIPSAGPIYLANTIFADNRETYYSVNSAPSGSMNGGALAHPANLTQANINTASTGTAAFTITVSNPSYQNAGQYFTATITVTSTGAATYANLKLRSALVESLHYATAPGTNGETDFHNVIRQMYDNNGANADGQTIDATWTAGQTRTYTIKGAVPSYVGSAPATPAINFLAAWIQKDDTKEVLQVGKTANITVTKPPVDVTLTSIGISGLKCQLPATIPHTIKVKNTGTTALTTARVYTSVNGATPTFQDVPLNNLAAGATSADLTLTALNVTTAGVQSVVDSVVLPNTVQDYNDFDNVRSSSAYVLNSTAVAIPLTFDFETANTNFSNFVSYPGTSIVGIIKATSQGLGHSGSNGLGYFPCYQLPQGSFGYLIFPKTTMPAGAKAIDFYTSYAQYKATDGTITGDKLELTYSTDCGTTWTSIWSKANADLASADPTGSNFTPTTASWKKWSVDVTNVPSDAYIAFKGTSNFGNNMFIDDINLRSGAATGIDELVAEGSFKVFPNPVSDLLNVSIDLKKASSVTYTVFNVLGQQVNAPVTKSMSAGTNTATINTNNLAAGMYYLNVTTEAGSVQQKFTKQ